jgi:hypothetical protein
VCHVQIQTQELEPAEEDNFFLQTVCLGYDNVSLGNLKEHSAFIIKGLEVWDVFLDIYALEDEGAMFHSKQQESIAQWHGTIFPKIGVLNHIAVATYNLHIHPSSLSCMFCYRSLKKSIDSHTDVIGDRNKTKMLLTSNFRNIHWRYWHVHLRSIQGLSGKYTAILNISRTGRVALM